MRDLSANERQLLAIIWRAGTMPRADVSRQSRLAQQSVHRLLEGLRAEQLLMLGEADIRGRGKPSPSIEIDGRSHASIGLALNSGAVRYCVADLRGTPLLRGELDVDPNDRDAVLDRFQSLVNDWKGGLLSGRGLIGLGVSMQGYRTGRGDVFQPSKRLPGWHNVPLIPLFEERFGLPSFIENNATSSAVAEHSLGGGGDYDCLAYLSFNTGFACGVMVRDAIFLGNHGKAGEINTLFTTEQKQVRPALFLLIERLRAAGAQIGCMADFCRNFRADDPLVATWLKDVTPQLQLAVRALNAIADPGAIFFGGDAPAPLRQMLVEAARESFGAENNPRPEFLVSGIVGDAAHLGAAFLPLHHRIYGSFAP